jgi:hypothetical protein
MEKSFVELQLSLSFVLDGIPPIHSWCPRLGLCQPHMYLLVLPPGIPRIPGFFTSFTLADLVQRTRSDPPGLVGLGEETGIDTGQVDPDSTNSRGQTPLECGKERAQSGWPLLFDPERILLTASYELENIYDQSLVIPTHLALQKRLYKLWMR